jgi:predicted O-methyltransferase YrrM
MFSIIESFSENPTVTVVKSSTIEFLLSKEDEYFDLVYIDADHSYDGVLNDLELSYKKVKRNGFICGHDYISGTACANAVNNFCNSKNLSIEYITEDGCPSFCIVKK